MLFQEHLFERGVYQTPKLPEMFVFFENKPQPMTLTTDWSHNDMKQLKQCGHGALYQQPPRPLDCGSELHRSLMRNTGMFCGLRCVIVSGWCLILFPAASSPAYK